MNNNEAKYMPIIKEIEKFVMGYYSYTTKETDANPRVFSETVISFFKKCSVEELDEFCKFLKECSDKRIIHYWISGDLARILGYLSIGIYDDSFDSVAENMEKILCSKKASNNICLAIYKSRLYQSHEKIEDYILDNYKDFGNDTLANILSTCSVDKVLKFKKHKIGKVRAIVYSRLGASKYIEEMAKDNYAKVRLLALEYLPKNDKRLSLFLNKEKSGQNLCILAAKIRKEHIPFLLSKTSKSSWAGKQLKKILQDRLSV